MKINKVKKKIQLKKQKNENKSLISGTNDQQCTKDNIQNV